MTSASRLCLLPLLVAACDPIWGASVKVRDPSDRPIERASVSLECPDGSSFASSETTVRSDVTGKAKVSGLGSQFPIDCDVVIAKPGFKTHTIPYRDLCPKGPDGCDRVFERDLVLQPEAPAASAPAP